MNFRFAREKKQCDQHTNTSAVACQPTFPNGKNPNRIIKKFAWIIKQHMPQPCTHDGRNNDIDRKRVNFLTAVLPVYR